MKILKMLDFPRGRQSSDHDCGAKALQLVLAYYGFDVREDKIIAATGTNPDDGTPIGGIERIIKETGLEFTSKSMSIRDVKAYIRRNIPVMLLLQAYAKKGVDWKNDWNDGHYTVAIGYNGDRIVFADPSSFRRKFLTFAELAERWHDRDSNGTEYLNYGIAVFGRRPAFKSHEIVHLN